MLAIVKSIVYCDYLIHHLSFRKTNKTYITELLQLEVTENF